MAAESKPRDSERDYKARTGRKAARDARGEPKRSEDATSIDEVMEAERDTGRREGARSKSKRPVTRYGPADKERVDAPPTDASSGPKGLDLPAGSLPSLGAPFVFETLLITVDAFQNDHRPPLPSRLLVAWGAFAALSFARGNASRAATAFAWGIVVATFYATANSGKPAGIQTLQTVGDFIAGKYGNSGSTGGTAELIPNAPIGYQVPVGKGPVTVA